MCRSGAFVLGLADQTTCHSKEGSEKKDLDFTGREDFGVTALCSEKEGDVAASCNRFQPSSEQRRVQVLHKWRSRGQGCQAIATTITKTTIEDLICIHQPVKIVGDSDAFLKRSKNAAINDAQ